jgi:hypothetical protein
MCGTDGHIHEGEFISAFPVREADRYYWSHSFTLLPFPYPQLIPGHEAVGSIVELGKNVKGFALGDRCVADVGITVGLDVIMIVTLLTAISAIIAFIVAGVNLFCARTSVRAGLAPKAGLRSTLHSTCLIHPITPRGSHPHTEIVRSISFTRSITSPTKRRPFSSLQHVPFTG